MPVELTFLLVLCCACLNVPVVSDCCLERVWLDINEHSVGDLAN
jgi:hypothetical protein